MVCPGFREVAASETATDATESVPVVPIDVTVMVALPDLYPRAAVIMALPAATPVTRPVESTEATDGLLELQVTVRVSGRL